MLLERQLTILYGSETGNSQDIAERIWQDSRRSHIRARICAADDWDIKDISHTNILIFICSTTGQGTQPTNMTKFWNKLRRKTLPPNCLSHLSFAILGLGDSSYFEFNYAAKKLYRRLEQLGGKSIVDLGLADECHELGIWYTVEEWVKDMWRSIESIMNPIDIPPIPVEQILPPRYKVVWMDPENDNPIEINVENCDADAPPHFFAKIISNTRVTHLDHFQDTRLLDIDISDWEGSYDPGDVAQVYPQNLEESIELAIRVLQLGGKLSHQFVLESEINGIERPPTWTVPRPCSVRQCLTQYWDFQCIPRHNFFRQLSYFSTDETEKERLEELCTPQAQEDLYSYCNRPRRSLVEVLQDFHKSAASVPFEYLFDLLPCIRPRSFSIASSPLQGRRRLQLLVVVVQYRTRLARPRLGLCSNWVTRLNNADKLALKISRGTLKFPKDSSKPIVMIGPGTGIAPFRSFVWDVALREGEKTQLKMQLYFGCRNKDKDFYFKEEWNELQKILGEKNFEIHTAFSRDQPQKIYVQHLIKDNNKYVRDMISLSAYILIAGNSKDMPTAVLQALHETMVDNGLKDDSHMDKMRQLGLIQSETWS